MMRTDLVGRAEFVQGLVDRFPSLRTELDEFHIRGLLHPEMGCFAQFAQGAVDAGDFELVRRCFEYAESLLLKPHPELENAVRVSFLEYLDFSGVHGSRAREMLPPRLSAALTELEAHLKKLEQGQS